MTEKIDLDNTDQELVVTEIQRNKDGTVTIEATILVYLKDGTYNGAFKTKLSK
ncbi:MAG: hypothetical protein WC365_06610 [Candidatus Babeliales bacterium]|jgi:hypothetical protein